MIWKPSCAGTSRIQMVQLRMRVEGGVFPAGLSNLSIVR